MNMRPELGGEFMSRIEVAGEADTVQHRTGVEQFKVVALAQHIAHDGGCLRRVRRAGHVGHHAAGLDGCQRGLEQLALERAEVREVLGGAAPA